MKVSFNKKQKAFFGAFLLSALAFNTLARELVIVTTPSIKPTLLIKSNTKIENDSYVTFKLNHLIIGGEKRITKKVGCNEGQLLREINRNFYCDFTFLGQAKEFTSNKHPLPLFKHKESIPQNKVFVIGEHPDSFDSRYFGFIDKSQLEPLTVIF